MAMAAPVRQLFYRDSLFDLRRILGEQIEWQTDSEQMPDTKLIRESLDKYQSIVRRGEPFFSTAVYR
jgi:hypothetical protein